MRRTHVRDRQPSATPRHGLRHRDTASRRDLNDGGDDADRHARRDSGFDLADDDVT
jgi:hypothetical protein